MKQKLLNLRHAAAAAVGVGTLAVSTGAHAALNGTVKTAIEGGFSDAAEAVGLMIVGFAGIFAVKLVMRLFNR